MLPRTMGLRLLLASAFIALVVPCAASATPLNGFAVVELFTSEGCSSCPPADQAFSQIVRDASAAGAPIYVLEWHVDYWDYLGWKDPFGIRFASERQYAYARALSSSVYTPQAVINGSLVPENAADVSGMELIAHNALMSAPAAHAAISLSAVTSENSIRIHADVRGAPRGSVLLLAIVESGLGATPTAGENAGRNLLHSNVVRSVKQIPASAADVILELPRDLKPHSSSLIGLIQDGVSMRIAAAAQVRIADRMAAGISGRVIDPAGNAVPGVHVQACSGDLCIPGVTDPRGFFAIDGVPPGTYAIRVGATEPSLNITLAKGESLTMPTIIASSRQ